VAFPNRRWRWILAAAVLAALFLPVALRTVRGGRALFDALQPVSNFATSVQQREVSVPVPGRPDIAMTLYTPVRDSSPATIVLVHGATAQGRLDSRLQSLACGLARAGFVVACPQLDALAAYSVEVDDIDQIVAATLSAAAETGAAQVALMGISIGGSYAIVAAGRPQLEGRLAALCTFGAAADLGASVVDWLAEPSLSPELALQGRVDLLSSNLPTLVPADELDRVRLALVKILAGNDPAQSLEFSDTSQRLLALARNPALADASSVRAVFAPLVSALTAVSPSTCPLPAHTTVFLAHAIADPLVPVAHLSRLTLLLENAGAPVSFQVTDIFDHVNAVTQPGWLDALPMAEFFGRFLDAADD